MSMNSKELLTFLGVGLVAGFLASIIIGGGGIIYYLLIGVIGSLVGGVVLDKIGVKINIGNDLVNKIATSAIGAIIVVIIARLIT